MAAHLMLLGCMVIATSPLRSGIELSHDSVNFVVAAQNLLEHGEFWVFSNWPSHSMRPEMEPFTVYPPGYAVYLVPFLAVFEEAFLAAAVAHALAIILFFLALAFLLRTLALPVPLRIAGYATCSLLLPYPIIFTHYLSEPLYLACTLGGAAFAVRALERDDEKSWIAAAACSFVASALKFVGVFNAVWFILPLMATQHARWQKGILAISSTMLPVFLWFVRNRLLHGHVDRYHFMATHDLGTTLLRPWLILTHEVLRVAPEVWVSLLVLCVALTLVSWPFIHVRPLGHHPRPTVHAMMVGAAAIHFFGLWVLSMATYFSLLEHRLLAPSITLAGVAILSGIDRSSQRSSNVVRAAFIALPFLFLALSRYTQRPAWPFNERHFALPAEAEAWQRIRASGMLDNATHFYSDHDLRHQLYARIPQRVIWDTSDIARPEDVQELLRVGYQPFFVMHTVSDQLQTLEKSLAMNHHDLQRTVYPEAGLVVYSMNKAHIVP